MVLLHLFSKSDYNYGVVHCNFMLRGNDSDQDEKFVEQQVLKLGVPFFTVKFETIEHARINGISIEMAARELRYRYFEEVRRKNQFNYIATAHHKDDLLETFFLNLSRKTGIKGLTGIKEKTGKIIRPVLFASRFDIVKFAQLNQLENREDASNDELIYQRNFIRHKILPLLNELNPAFRNNLFETIGNLRDAEEIYSWYLNIERTKVISFRENQPVIDVKALLNTPFPRTLLYEILSEYNFNPKVSAQVYASLDGESGKVFFSRDHRIVKDRNHLYVTSLPDNGQQLYYIEEDDMELFSPFELSVQSLSNDNLKLIKSRSIAFIDKDKVEFPLLIRKWKAGDYFQPLGMTGFKKLSDFFIDEKFPLHKKENAWLLCSGPKVVWVIGHRLDNRFKITPETKRVLKIEIQQG